MTCTIPGGASTDQFRTIPSLLCCYSDPYGYCPFMEITVIYFADKIVIESALTADLHTDHCLGWVHYYFGYSPCQKYYVGNIIPTEGKEN